MSKKINNPSTLSESFDCLNKILKDSEDLEWFQTSSEELAISESHYGIGEWIRKEWGLDGKSSKLYDSLFKIGFRHSDDMSIFILTSYHRHINKKELSLDTQVKTVIEYWKNKK